VDQPSATTPSAAPEQPPDPSRQLDAATPSRTPGFGSRGRLRRRARFLRKARELAYRDLGGLVFNLHRFGQRNDSLVLAKLSTLSRIDAELRALESSLSERQPVTVLREAGITACPRCAAIHSGEDRFCPNCGLPMSRNVDLPIAGAAGAAATETPAAGTPAAGAFTAAPSVEPATAAHAPVPASAGAAAVAPAPTAPVTAAPAVAGAPPSPPAHAPTQTHATIPPASTAGSGERQSGGRSPVPPMPAKQPGEEEQSSEEDQPTEIIRPPATGS
jgi:hypothetical protein